MFQKLDDVEKRYEELTIKISDPEVIAKTNEWQKLMKEHSDMTPIVEKYKEYKKIELNYKEAKEMLESETDKEMKDLAEVEMLEAKEKLPEIEEELKFLLIPKDPDDDKNVICEIRGGAGGEEAALFAGTLFRMYSMYSERKHWKIEILNENENKLDIEYKLKSDTNITIEGNYNLADGSIVIISVTDGKKIIDYYFNVYINKTEEVNKSIVNGTLLEVDSKKEISEYAGPGIACLCFVLILFLFVFLFHKRKAK